MSTDPSPPTQSQPQPAPTPTPPQFSYETSPYLYLFTSFTAGSSHIVTATSRLTTILRANRIPFRAVDLATDNAARRIWTRRAAGRKIPGLVREGFVLAGLDEVEEWNEFGEINGVLGWARGTGLGVGSGGVAAAPGAKGVKASAPAGAAGAGARVFAGQATKQPAAQVEKPKETTAPASEENVPLGADVEGKRTSVEAVSGLPIRTKGATGASATATPEPAATSPQALLASEAAAAGKARAAAQVAAVPQASVDEKDEGSAKEGEKEKVASEVKAGEPGEDAAAPAGKAGVEAVSREVEAEDLGGATDDLTSVKPAGKTGTENSSEEKEGAATEAKAEAEAEAEGDGDTKHEGDVVVPASGEEVKKVKEETKLPENPVGEEREGTAETEGEKNEKTAEEKSRNPDTGDSVEKVEEENILEDSGEKETQVHKDMEPEKPDATASGKRDVSTGADQGATDAVKAGESVGD